MTRQIKNRKTTMIPHKKQKPGPTLANGLTTYQLTPEEIEARYGHLKPPIKGDPYRTTAVQSRARLFSG